MKKSLLLILLTCLELNLYSQGATFNQLLNEYQSALAEENVSLAIQKLNEMKVEAFVSYESKLPQIEKNIELLSSIRGVESDFTSNPGLDTMITNYIEGFADYFHYSHLLENFDYDVSLDEGEAQLEDIGEKQFAAIGKYSLNGLWVSYVSSGYWSVSSVQKTYLAKVFNISQECSGSGLRFEYMGSNQEYDDPEEYEQCTKEDYLNKIRQITSDEGKTLHSLQNQLITIQPVAE